jgi:hypothetical protein
MEKGKLKINDLKLLYNSQPLSQYLHAPLFQTRDGDNVWSGDTVSFYINGEHLPHNGTVSNLKGLRVDCFNTFLNKWEYYLLEE